MREAAANPTGVGKEVILKAKALFFFLKRTKPKSEVWIQGLKMTHHYLAMTYPRTIGFYFKGHGGEVYHSLRAKNFLHPFFLLIEP
jgi:hypothetical protein